MTLPVLFGGGAGSGSVSSTYTIPYSARFNGTSDYLSRTPGVAGNRRTFTLSWWAKLSDVASGSVRTFFCALTNTSNSEQVYYIAGSTTIGLYITSQTGSLSLQASSLLRDPAAWMHFVVTFDTTQATASNRVKLYINGTQITSFASATYPNLNDQFNFCAAVEHRIGRVFDARYGSGYMSDVYIVDGQALTPTSFGKTDSNGVWVPIKYAGTYGTNGCKLEFKSSGALGTDTSGNGNTWTVNSSPVQTTDTPSNNYATFNPLNNTAGLLAANGVLSNGNLLLTDTSGNTTSTGVFSTVAAPYTGNWVAEFTLTQSAGDGWDYLGVTPASTAWSWTGTGLIAYRSGAQKYQGGWSSYGATFTTNDVIGVVVNNGTVTFYKNGVSQGSLTGAISQDFLFNCSASHTGNGTTTKWTANFGATAFAYPNAYGSAKALCTANLPEVSITKPSDHFNVVLAAGASIKTSSEALYTYFLEWIKDRANSNNHQIIDTVRGTSAVLQSNNIGVETTYSAPSGTSVGWVWKAGGAAVSNTAGSITSSVSANTTAGFSVVKYTGTGSAATVGHGLGATPKLVVVKLRNAANGNWCVWHNAFGAASNTDYLTLESTVAKGGYGALNLWNGTAPTSTVLSLGTNLETNKSTGTFVAYCFAEIPGYSKFGSYVGNGSADGPFIYCGFRPRYILFKNASAAGMDWVIHDTVRETYNVMGGALAAESSLAESSFSGSWLVDVTATGFKLRNTDGSTNGSTNTIVFAAFAEYPFGGSNVAPATAR